MFIANQFHLLSDLKFNEGYANFKINRFKNAIDAFTQSHLVAIKSKINLTTYQQKVVK